MEANWVSREWKVLEKIQGYYIEKVAHKDWYFVTKIVLTYCEKNCPIVREKLLKFQAEG